jgi:cell division protein FtsX
MQLPFWFDGVVVGLLIVGLPVAIIVSWVFDLTPDGVVRTILRAISPASP